MVCKDLLCCREETSDFAMVINSFSMCAKKVGTTVCDIFHCGNGRYFIAVILSILGSYFACYNRFSGEVMLPSGRLS